MKVYGWERDGSVKGKPWHMLGWESITQTTDEKKPRWTWKSTTMCYGWICILVHRKSQLLKKKKKSESDLARLHPVWNTEKNATKNTKGLPGLKTGHTLSARQEAIQRKQARETIMTKEYFCAPGDKVQNLCGLFGFFFGIVIGKRFGKGSEMKTAFKHCICKMLRTSN